MPRPEPNINWTWQRTGWQLGKYPKAAANQVSPAYAKLRSTRPDRPNAAVPSILAAMNYRDFWPLAKGPTNLADWQFVHMGLHKAIRSGLGVA